MTQRTTNLATFLTQTAARLPNRPAIIRGDTVWTWSVLNDRVDALAAAMREEGVGIGSKVLFHSANCLDSLTVFYATWRVGAIIVPTNFKLLPDDVASLARRVDPDLIVCHDSAAAHAEVLADYEIWSVGDDSDGAEFGTAHVSQLIDKHDVGGASTVDEPVYVDSPAWYFFTSGTSGLPKAAVLGHHQMAFVTTNHIADLMPGLTEQDATLVLAPLSHGAGVHTLTHVARGAAIVLTTSETLNAVEAWDLIQRHAVSTMFTVPTILNKLVQAAPADYVPEAGTLRYVVYAGAPMSSRDQQIALDRLGKVLVQYYGLCEVTGNITVLPTEMHGTTPEPDGIPTAGYARTGMTISIQDEQGHELDPGQRGEICVCGPAVFAGYLDNPAANAKAFRHGWFRTGDLGYLDPTGLLYITGRASDMYISGGSNIDPREVEEKLLKHPDLVAAGVTGAPDETWGEVGFALCVPAPGSTVTPAEVLDWCKTNMVRYKVPKHLEFTGALPTSGYGKVTTALLREEFITRGTWPEAQR
ncbi:AMP-binding protein [Rhodococcus fascians]|nr:AMP-binding protein [Rhodococcus fascians]MBY3997805.1 AMP-binding protein [Rhodococcus fascians]MBY4002812.1 AMP-binding protein [Rhodococcus fascians]MBY4006803.1 AMP-binding protein [Rhodococcus fascians]MBY4019410.1 AMP-binding protein [Rhodococcus fascians]